MIIRMILLIVLSMGLFYLVKKNNVSLTKGVFVVVATLSFSSIIKFSVNNIVDYQNLSNKIIEVKEKISIINNSLEETKLEKETIELLNKEFEYQDLETKKSEVIEEKSNLDNIFNEKEKVISLKNNQYNELLAEYKKLKQKKLIINNFKIVNQFPNYPNGCEAVSLYMILKYYNVDVSLEKIVNELKKGEAPHYVDGYLIGANPEIEYVGNPKETNGKGYGVYQKPIIDLANKYKKGMKDITGTNLVDVLKLVKEGKPVQVWASVNMRNTYVCITWRTKDNIKVDWMCGLHSLVIIGFSTDKVIAADPYTGKIEYYNKTRFEKMYNQYGKRAIYYEE